MTSEASVLPPQQQQRRRRVCLFGTSADPPTGHGGHYGIVSHLVSLRQHDEIRILPVYRHMYAEKRNRLTDFDVRLEMCRLTFADLSSLSTSSGPPQVVISPVERLVFEKEAASLKQQQGNDDSLSSLRIGTAHLLEHLLQEEPHVEFTLVLGLDTFLDLMRGLWKRSLEVIGRVHGRIWVVAREGGDEEDSQAHAWIQTLNAQYGAGAGRWLDIPHSGGGGVVVSSSLARSTRCEKELNSLVLPSVAKFIQTHKLYQFGESPEKEEED